MCHTSAASMVSHWPMILISEAQQIVLQHTRVLDTEPVSVAQALGRILGQDVTAPDALPPFPASIKVSTGNEIHGLRLSISSDGHCVQDGYAVVAADGAGDFPVSFEARAGELERR